MCGDIDCKECRHKCKEDVTNREAEKLWEELEDVLLMKNDCLDVDWQGWDKGTHIEEIWHWFDEHHSKGVGWLMNEYEI